MASSPRRNHSPQFKAIDLSAPEKMGLPDCYEGSAPGAGCHSYRRYGERGRYQLALSVQHRPGGFEDLQVRGLFRGLPGAAGLRADAGKGNGDVAMYNP